MKQYTFSYNEYKDMFENNEDNTFNRLVISADGVNEELNLTGKTLANLTSDETARMEQYSEYVRNHVVDPQEKRILIS